MSSWIQEQVLPAPLQLPVLDERLVFPCTGFDFYILSTLELLELVNDGPVDSRVDILIAEHLTQREKISPAFLPEKVLDLVDVNLGSGNERFSFFSCSLGQAG